MSDLIQQAMPYAFFGGGPAGPSSSKRVQILGTSRDIKYWVEQGWALSGYSLDGWYRTVYGAFRGTIKLSDSGDHQYFIVGPPPQLQQHSHAACFRYRGNDTYWVHFNDKPGNVDEGIQRIEMILREAIELHS